MAMALAKKFRGELVAADSRTIYRGMDIGTAKPREYPHHLIDIVPPWRTLTLAEWKSRALREIRGIIRRGKIPIIVGGTGLYVSSLIDNWKVPKVPPDTKLRARLTRRSVVSLLRELKKRDPASAAAIDPKNKRRLIRALEVCIKTGKPFSALREKGEPLFDAMFLGVRLSRQKLYARIDARVDSQMRAGWLEETKQLLRKLRRRMPEREIWKLPGMSGLGYRELGAYLRGEISLPEAVALIKRDTRRYAKRQLTWWRREKRIRWVRGAAEAARLTQTFLRNH